MNINRTCFRVSETASAQHETALGQAVSKLLALGKTTPDKITIVKSNILTLGTLLITGVYDEGQHKVTIATLFNEDGELITQTNPSTHGLPKTLS